MPHGILARKVTLSKTVTDDYRFRPRGRASGNVVVVEISPRDEWNLHRAEIFSACRAAACQLLQAARSTLQFDVALVLKLAEWQIVDRSGDLHSGDSSNAIHQFPTQGIRILRRFVQQHTHG